MYKSRAVPSGASARVVERNAAMKLSARNMIKGAITDIELGSVNAVVKLDIGGGQTLSSMITLDAVRDMDLKVGDDVFAIIKSSNVILGTM
jgi:molybdopterin-binding protein